MVELLVGIGIEQVDVGLCLVQLFGMEEQFDVIVGVVQVLFGQWVVRFVDVYVVEYVVEFVVELQGVFVQVVGFGLVGVEVVGDVVGGGEGGVGLVGMQWLDVVVEVQCGEVLVCLVVVVLVVELQVVVDWQVELVVIGMEGVFVYWYYQVY